MKPTVFNHKQYTDLEADYMILKAENEKLNRLLINMQEECDIADAANTALHGALEEAERREKAAVEDIYKMTDGECDVCKHYNPDKNTCAKPFVPRDECFEWRGAKGGAE